MIENGNYAKRFILLYLTSIYAVYLICRVKAAAGKK